ncbi:MAG: TonB family protein [Acidobacteriota bacterium]
MPEEILVVEYEPRYIDRVRKALSEQPLTPLFAKDGDEAIRAITASHPRLIVLSSVIPRISTGELIRQLRNRIGDDMPPILVTISGYSGKTPKIDAAKIGASDILPKPYSESEFTAKVRQILGLPDNEKVSYPAAVAEEFSVSPNATRPGQRVRPGMTAEQMLSELMSEDTPRPATATHRKVARADPDIDKMLADTLSGVRLNARHKTESDGKTGPRSAAPKADLDRLVEDTLSGLEAKIRKRVEAAVAATRQEDPDEAAATEVHSTVQSDADVHGGVRFGQYLLVEKIATGGMAEVWKARMRGVEGFQKIVAIKKILPHLSDNSDFVDMFIDEAKLAAQLNHGNIIHIYDLGKIARSYYIAMEFVDGHDLKTILKRASERELPLPPELALFVTSKIASALDYAHRKRDFDENELELVHRDISPQNVLISYEGDIKLCDFGIAKAASKASHTLSGALKGKLQYMSPEQAWGRKIDRRSDIFALGAVLFEMLTGRKLFLGDNELSVLEQVRQAKVLAPSSINPEVTREIDIIVQRALEREPEDRYQTAGELAKDLDSVIFSASPTPTSADLAIYMHRLYENVRSEARPLTAVPEPDEYPSEDEDAEELILAPVPVETEVPVPGAAEAVTHSGVSAAEPSGPTFGVVAEKKRSPVVAIAASLILVTALAAGGWAIYRKQTPAGPANLAAAKGQSQPVRPSQEGTTNTAAPSQPPPVVVDPAAAAASALSPGTVPSNDQASADQDVKKRLDAERLRLDTQRATQAAATRNSPAPAAAAPRIDAIPAPATETQQATPPVIEATPQPTPAVVPTATPAPPPEVRATAQPTQAAVVERPVREGDLVPAGTQGLVQPALIHQFKPPYPPLAKMQRVEGIVVLSALISETGRVLEVKILRGVSANVGINEAAVEAIRRSTFSPATKDGVKVRTYKTITIPFKL